jgi:raffinose/stachyose/melibiose transport system permease protein
VTALQVGNKRRVDAGRKARYSGIAGLRSLPYLLIVPGLAFYLAFVMVPIVQTVGLSFVQWDGLLAPVWVGFDNFKSILSDPTTLQSFVVSFVMIIFTCALPIAVALLLVAVIVRTKVRGLSFLRFVYFLPYTVALAVVAIAWRWIYAADGTLNMAVGAIFGKGAVTAYLGNFTLALPALGIVAFWATFGFVTVLLLSGAQHIPHELYEASRIDGAGPIREFFTVTLPGLKHELRVSLVMTFIMSMRTFDLPFITTQGGPGFSTTTPVLTMYRDVFMNGLIGQGSAIAVLVTLVTIIGVAIISRVIKSED